MLQIVELVISQSLVKFIEQLVEEDGSVKDSAVGQSMHLLIPFLISSCLSFSQS